MNPRGLGSTAGWGLYCACSWTWCIGLYLPVILVRELGWPGVAVFALPNILGAAAFGYVLRNRAGSENLIARHGSAARWFSVITVAYQAYFAAFIVAMVAPPEHGVWPGLAAGGGVMAAGVLLALLPSKAWPILAVVVYGLSLATLARLGPSNLLEMKNTGARPALGLVWLAPVMVFGFLLCPYLDLTFHRALREARSRHAFAVFGATFAVMIALTCVYRNYLPLALVPLAHILAQTVFTTAAHLRELRVTGPARLDRHAVLAILLGVVLLVAAAGGWAAGEAVYLRFLVFYGLVFPAYVLVFVGPGRGVALTRRSLITFALAVIIAMPFYELGFIHNRLWLLPIPVAVLLGWAIAARR